MKILYRLIVLFISLHCVGVLQAQSVCLIQEYSTEDGLPQRNVSNIIQDHYGFIWFATWNGLCKFDGYTFKKYKAYPGDGNNLSNNRFHLNGVDKDNNIWCRTYDSRFFRLDTRTGKFIDPLLDIEKKKGTQYQVRKTYNLKDGATWMICNYTAFRVENHSGKDIVTEYSSALGNLPGSYILNVQQDSDGDEWIFTDGGAIIIGKKRILDNVPYKELAETSSSVFLISDTCLVEYDKKTAIFRSIELPCNFHSLQNIYGLDEESVAVGTERGIFVYSTITQKLKFINLESLGDGTLYKVDWVYKDKYGDLWVFANLKGVIHIKQSDGTKRLLLTRKNAFPFGVKKNRQLIFEDKQGVLWLTPNNGNFSYYDREKEELKPYYLEPNNPETVYNPLILSSWYDGQNTLWFADNKHLTKVSFMPDACKIHSLDEYYETRAFLTDDTGQLWVASKKKYVYIYHPDGRLKGYLSPEGEIRSTPVVFGGDVYCFLQDKDGNIWLGTKGAGISRMIKVTDRKYRIEKFVHDAKDPYSLSHDNVYSICQDSRGRIWIGTHEAGLNLLERKTDGGVRFIHGNNGLNYPIEVCPKVRYVTEIRNTLFVGTTTGLVTFSLDFESPEEIVPHLNVFRPDDTTGLSSSNVMHIFEDSKKDIYVLTFSGGINRLKSTDLLIDSMEFKNYTLEKDIPSDLVYSMIEDPMKNLWVVAENAFFKFNSQNGTFDSYDSKYLPVEQLFSEALPVLWNNKLVLGIENGFLEVNPDKLRKSTYEPPVYLTELVIWEERKRIALDGVKEIELLPGQRSISLSFTTLDYVEPRSVQYAYRMEGLEKSWDEVDNNRQARYINLPPGTYEFQVKATNSDGRWGEHPAVLTIHVVPTFWETNWAVLLYAILLLVIGAAIVYIFLVIFRLRHRVDMEQQLADIKLRFFTDISHELRIPLTLITSPVVEVLEHGNLSPTDREHLEMVHGNTERMLQLVNQILDFRKIENRKMKLLLEHTEVVEEVRRLMNNFSLMAEEKNIDFSLHAGQSPIYAWVDRDKFQKVLLNLMSNAFKYTLEGKAIRVTVSSDAANLSVSVKDQGIGVEPQKLPHLFKRFETLVQDNILQPSSGIGLSLVKELVELHLGEITVESEVGVGSNFTISLPMEKTAYDGIDYKEFILGDSAPPLVQIPETEQETTTDGEDVLKVLVVEDNNELRLFLKNILTDTYKVVEAVNGQEGLELAHQCLPDFIISDVMMPVMDGLDMVKAIKNNRDICHIPIILLSAKSSLDDRISGLEQGVDDYITKPFSSTYLKTRIRLLLQQRKQLRAFYQQNTDNDGLEEINLETVSPFDRQFMDSFMQIIERNIDNSDFSIDEFSQEMHMSRTFFYKKVKSLTGLSPVDFLLDVRIKRSLVLLDSEKYNVSTIAYMIGFNDPKYFSKFFKKRMGLTPSEYLKQKE